MQKNSIRPYMQSTKACLLCHESECNTYLLITSSVILYS